SRRVKSGSFQMDANSWFSGSGAKRSLDVASAPLPVKLMSTEKQSALPRIIRVERIMVGATGFMLCLSVQLTRPWLAGRDTKSHRDPNVGADRLAVFHPGPKAPLANRVQRRLFKFRPRRVFHSCLFNPAVFTEHKHQRDRPFYFG